MPKLRCINIDWLEVYCIEPMKLDANYYRALRYRVVQRDYGTPMYAEMFTVYNGKEALIEVRRDPYSRKSEGGIFDDHSVHLRLPNKQCYKLHPVEFLQAFIKRHGYHYVNTTRIDFCLDFNTFDYNRDVPNFIRKYMAGRYFKMNQSRLQAHGADCWPLREFWSLKWGSPESAITTKLYDKTLELCTAGHDKPYIWDAWKDSGLDTEKQVYRVEFSIKGSEVKQLYKNDKERVQTVDVNTGEITNPLRKVKRIVKLDFNNFPTRQECLFTFMALANKYFDFRESTVRNGKPVRRDRCPRVTLFVSTQDEQGYRPLRFVTNPMPGRTELQLAKRLILMSQDTEHYTDAFRDECKSVAAQLMKESRLKKRGVELPVITENLKLIAERPQMSEEQLKRYIQALSEQTKRLMQHHDEVIQRYRNAPIPKTEDLPF